jgi:hypothetical protein
MRKLLTNRQGYIIEWLIFPPYYMETLSKINYKVFFIFNPTPKTSYSRLRGLNLYYQLIDNCLSK